MELLCVVPILAKGGVVVAKKIKGRGVWWGGSSLSGVVAWRGGGVFCPE